MNRRASPLLQGEGQDMYRRIVSVVVASLIATSAGLAPAVATRTAAVATVPPGFTDTLVTSVPAPTDVAFVPGTSSIFIATQPGQLRVYRPSASMFTALDLSAQLCSNSERGLLGIAVDPAFGAGGGFIYLYYTYRKFGTCGTNSSTVPVNRVSRFTASPDLSVSLASEVVLLDNIPSVAGNHNGGDLDIGADGLLYISVGDGGCKIGDSSRCAGQNDNARFLSTPLGKILRIGRDGSIPSSNPWNAAAGARRCGDPAGVPTGSGPCRETFAWGLRNPFRMAFRPGTNAFHINDVGQGQWEEIDAGIAGADYGWNVREGHCANGSTTNCGAPPAGMTNPIYDYGRATGCASITGGAFVPAGAWPAAYEGAYMFADYVCGRIWRLTQDGGGTWSATDFATGLGSSSAVTLAFGPSAVGQSLYYTTYAGGGSVRRIDGPVANQPPTAALGAAPTSGTAPLGVSFDATGSNDPDGDALEYQFTFGDGSSTTTSSPTVAHTYTGPGSYTASLVVSDGRGGVSAPATRLISVVGGNSPPQPTIAAPGPLDTYAVGQTVTLSGSATDAEDGTLPSSALSWTVILHHDTHTHPFLGPVSGTGISFTTPPPEDLAATSTSYLEIRLTATDSAGASTTIVRDFQPTIVPITFETQPSGLTLVVNGVSITGPTTVTSWQGYALNVSAPTQVNGNKTYAFQRWSDGGAESHTILTPGTAEAYSAKFKPAKGGPFELSSGGGDGPSGAGGANPAGALILRR